MQNTPADEGRGVEFQRGGCDDIPTILRRDEQVALRYTNQAHLDRLFSLGVTVEALATLGLRQLPFGAMSISTDDAGRWWPDDDDGFPAIVVPVREYGETIDIIAFRTTAPARWFWRLGCGTMLGADILHRGYWPGDKLHLVTTPIGWLAAAGEAVCILDWSLPDHELSSLRDYDELICDSPLLAQRIRKRLSQPRRVPPISFAKEAARA